jgi:polyphenol oxidase
VSGPAPSIPVREADWPAPPGVRVVVTLRGPGGGPYRTWNFARHVGDDPARVDDNRARLRTQLRLPGEPAWLEQVHGCTIVDAAQVDDPVPADGSVANGPGVVCAVMTADCLPLALCSADGGRVAVVHVGWRGLAAGVVESGLARLGVPAGGLLAWMGPAIGPDAFEVGAEVRDALLGRGGDAADVASTFRPSPRRRERWLVDLYGLVRMRLAALGVPSGAIHGGNGCTVSEPEAYFSYRRDRHTGRMATLAWIDERASGGGA